MILRGVIWAALYPRESPTMTLVETTSNSTVNFTGLNRHFFNLIKC